MHYDKKFLQIPLALSAAKLRCFSKTTYMYETIQETQSFSIAHVTNTPVLSPDILLMIVNTPEFQGKSQKANAESKSHCFAHLITQQGSICVYEEVSKKETQYMRAHTIHEGELQNISPPDTDNSTAFLNNISNG